MKKILFAALLSTSVIAVQAQFGLKGGATFSTWHGSDVNNSDVDGLVGAYFGAFYNAHVSTNFSVQPEVAFSAEGAKDANSSEKARLDYINLSVLPRYNNSGWFIGTGPQLGLLISAKDKGNGGSIDIKDELKGSNFSWAFATGYDLKVGLGFDVRYNLGLSNISDSFFGSATVKQSVWNVGVHYSFSMMSKK